MIDRLWLSRYLKLIKAHLVARKFYRGFEGLTRDVAFQAEMDVHLDVYSPEAKGSYPVLVFVHGGGWRQFNRKLFAPAAMKLLPEDMVVVIPDYTKYPHAGYEQMTREVAAALSWTLENIGDYGGDPSRVVIAGQSSGGHLTGLAMTDPRFLREFGHSADEVYGVAYVSGGYDLCAQRAYELEKGGEKGTDLLETMIGITAGVANFGAASPIKHVRGGLPPTLIIHGSADQTIPVGQAIVFHTALWRAGVRSELKIYPGRGHSEILFSALTEERPRIVADISDFVHGRLRQIVYQEGERTKAGLVL